MLTLQLIFYQTNGLIASPLWSSIATVQEGDLETHLLMGYDMIRFSKVRKSVHHRTIQINHQPDAEVFQFIILTFIYSSTCFGRFPAHHQELNDCSGSLWFYLRIVVIVVLCSWSGRPASQTTNTARLSPRYEGKTRGYHCSHWASDDGRKTPEICWAVNKRQDNKLENCCMWLVIYLNWNDVIYLLTAVALTHAGSSTVHIYTKTIHRTTQWNRIPRTERTYNKNT
jgi:hypothetical protein